MRVGPWSMLALVIALVAPMAVAQRLDLDAAPEQPLPAFLKRIEKSARETSESVRTGPAQREILRIGLAALTGPGEERIVWGITLIQRAEQIQRAVERASGEHGIEVTVIVGGLAGISVGLPPELARAQLSKVLAGVAEHARGGDPAEMPLGLASLQGFSAIVEGAGAPEDAVRGAARLEALVGASRRDLRAFGAALSMSADGAAIRTVLESAPKWFAGGEAEEAFRGAVWLALAQQAITSSGDEWEWAERLRGVGAFARLVLLAEGLPTSTSREPFRAVLVKACRSGLFSVDSSGPRLARIYAWLETVVGVGSGVEDGLRVTPMVVPALKPLYTSALKDLDRSRERMTKIAGSMIASGTTFTDPEFVAARTSHAELAQREALLLAASRGMEDMDRPGRARPEFAGVSARILANGKAIGRKKDSSVEAVELSQLLDEIARFGRLPREEAFGASGSEQDLAIADQIAKDRAAWLKKVSNRRQSNWSAEAGALNADEAVLRFLAETLPARQGPTAALARVNADPAWQIRFADWTGAVRELNGAARRAMALLAAGDRTGAVEAVRRVEDQRRMVVAALARAKVSVDPEWMEIVLDPDDATGVAETMRSWGRSGGD